MVPFRSVPFHSIWYIYIYICMRLQPFHQQQNMSNTDTMRWSEPRLVHDNGPPIKNHTLTYHDGLLICFGGYDGRKNHASLSVFSVQDNQWYPVAVEDPDEDNNDEEADDDEGGGDDGDDQGRGSDDDNDDDDDDSSSAAHPARVHPHILRRTRSSSISLLSISSGSANNHNRSASFPTAFKVCGHTPPGRNGHTATLVKRKLFIHDYYSEQTCIFMIGGWLGVGPLAAADMFILDITNSSEFRWIPIAPHDISGTSPGPCNMHSADFVSSQNEIYIFRGGNGREYLNDTHALHVDTLTWRRVETTGSIPQPRANHSSAILDETNELIIFGGWNGRERLNDIHILDITTSTWSKPFVGGLLPHPRAGMTFTALHGRLFLYGGSGPSSKCFQDLHIFDRKDMVWLDVMHLESSRTLAVSSTLQERTSSGVVGAAGGRHHNMIANPSSSSAASMDHGHFFIQGLNGSRQDPDTSNTHAASLGGGFQRLSQQGEAEGRGGKKATTSISGNPNDAENTPTIYVHGKGPGRRAGHTATAVQRKIYLFGGSCGNEYLNDLFVLDTDPVPQLLVTEPTSLDLLKKRLSFFVNEDDFSDVVFTVEGKRVPGHRMILSLVSDCFRAMFTTGFRESTMVCPEIEIPNCSYDSFLAMMEYIYTGQAPKLLSLDHEVDLLSLADQFMLDHLKQLCERMLLSRISLATIGHLLQVSQKCNAPQLEAACRHYERNQEML